MAQENIKTLNSTPLLSINNGSQMYYVNYYLCIMKQLGDVVKSMYAPWPWNFGACEVWSTHIRRKVPIQTSDLENGWSKALSPASVIDEFPYFVCLQNA